MLSGLNASPATGESNQTDGDPLARGRGEERVASMETTAIENYPNPEELRNRAEQLASTAESVSDASEYPRLAKMAVQRQAEAMQELANAIEDSGAAASTPKRPGMTGEERRERRAAILRIRAARLKAKAADLHRHSHDIGSRIPFGQPILVGHHSERGHRRAVDRMHKATGAAIAADSYGNSLDERADRVERNGAILSSDSDAVDQLNRKIEESERLQTQMKLVNKAHKAFLKDPESLSNWDLPEHLKATIRTYAPRYSWEPHPIAPYQFTNLSANIRRMKERLKQISAAKAAPESSKQGSVATVEDCPAENRVRLAFPGKPSEEIRTRLKRSGFRWAPSLGVWQAYRHAHTIAIANEIAA